MFPNIGNPLLQPRRSTSPGYRPLLTTRVPLNQSTWRLNAQPVRFIGYRRRSSFERRQQQLESERKALLEAGKGDEVHDYDALVFLNSESPTPPDVGTEDSTNICDIPPKLPQTEGHSHAQNQSIVLPEVCRHCQTHKSPMSNEPQSLPPQAPKIPGKIVVKLPAQPGPQGTVNLTSRAHAMKTIVDAMQNTNGTPNASVRFTGGAEGPSSEQFASYSKLRCP